jgi:outer membrane protein TolC
MRIAMTAYRLIILLTLCIGAFPSVAQQPLSLSDAIQIGLENSYQIRIAETNREIAENSNDWAVAGRYPAISLTLNNQNGYRNINNPISFIPELYSFSTGFTPGANASLTLFDGYRVRYNKERLEQEALQSEQQIALAVESTIQQVINAYYQALVQQEQVDVLEEVLELSRDRIAYQKAQQEFGQAGTFDFLQTQDAYLNDSTNYLLQKNNLDVALRTLKQAMGVDDPTVSFRLTGELDIPAARYELGGLRQKMLAANKQLQDAYITRELAQTNRDITQANRYPRVALNTTANYDWSISSGQGTTSNGEIREIQALASRTVNVGLNFSVNYTLFDWGVRNINEQNARLQEVNTQYQIEDLKRQLNAQLENTYATYLNQQQLVAVNEQLLANAARNMEIAEERFRGGLINSFDYRTIQVAYLNAAFARLNAIFNLKQTETELLRITGGLVR